MFSRTTTRIIAVSAAVLCSLPLTACFTEDNSVSGNNIKISLPFKPVASLSPFSDDALLNTRMGVTETLVNLDSEGNLIPGLAESWEAPDTKTVVFKLRSGVKFHDGTDLNAEAAAESINKAVSAAARPKGLGKADIKATAKSDTEVEVTSDKDDPILAQRFTDAGTVILAKKAYEGSEPSLVGTATGPFKVVSVSDSEVKTEAFADYWGGKPQLDGVTTTFSADGSTRARAVQSGEVSLTQAIPISQLGSLGDVKTEFTVIPRGTYLHFNTKKGVFADPAMRAKAAEVVDPATVVKDIYEGHAGDPNGSLFAQNSEWAKSVISKNSLAGATDPEVGTKITLATWDSRPELPEAATVIADQLRKAGFEVEVTQKPYDTLEEALLSGEFDVVLGNRNYGLGAADPVSFLSSDYTCDGGYNLSQYCNPDIDNEINSALEIANVDERYAKAAEIGAKIVADNAVIPIAHENSVISYKNLEGVDFDTYERKLVTKDTKITR
ncbi:MAG: ABC transporter substrate-binding protein [Corynebacterium sp.]|nr:ABC transporter substrate-binding protein [Corynebacterium sp.]